MKKHIAPKLNTYVRANIQLSASERRALREQLVSFMEYHPRTESSLRELRQFEPFTSVSFTAWYMRPIAGVFALIVLVFVPMAAEKAVPGDTLYPLKVRVNEEIQEKLSFTPYEKVAWSVERLERRVAEARLLAQEGKLTAEAETELAATLKEHAEEAHMSLAELRSTDANKAAVAQITLESALDVQSAILDTEDGSATATPIAEIARAVQDAKTDAVKGDDTPLPTYDAMMASVETETTRARELFASVSHTVTDTEKSEIERRFSDIDRAVLFSKDERDAGRESEGVAALKTALGDTQKLIAFMTDIDVRGSGVELEALVPKKLTMDERIARINGTLESLRATYDRFQELSTQVNADVALKIGDGVKRLLELMHDAETKRGQNDLDGADVSLRDAEALAADILTLHERGGSKTSPAEAAGSAASTTDARATSTSAAATTTATQ
jgi:hypothetical protein